MKASDTAEPATAPVPFAAHSQAASEIAVMIVKAPLFSAASSNSSESVTDIASELRKTMA